MNEITVPIGSSEWSVRFQAAELAPQGAASPLPPKIGDITLMGLDHAFNTQHPLQKMYPHMRVSRVAMILHPVHFVERNGVRGVALYVHYNALLGRPAACISVTSEGGLNPLAPYHWQHPTVHDMEILSKEQLQIKYGIDCNPQSRPWPENRRVSDPNDPYARQGDPASWIYTWQSYMVHGLPQFANKADWRDGQVWTGKHMHVEANLGLGGYGQVKQSIFVPKMVEGIGSAEQTLSDDAVKDSYSILLFGAKDTSLLPPWPAPARRRGGLEAHVTFGPTTLSRSVVKGESTEPEAEFKMAAGGLIDQAIHEDPYGVNFWNDEPERLLVFYPMTEETARTYAPGAHRHITAGRLEF